MKDKAKQKQLLKDIIKSDEELGLYEDLRYYVPTIEEFHVGFEYEEDDNNTNNWEKQIIGIDNTWDLEFLKDIISEGNCRVKHLDREDIEGLGFEHDSTMKSFSTFIYGSIITKNHWFLRFHKDGLVDICDVNKNSDNCFFGTVKNKSELKRILTQIGVL